MSQKLRTFGLVVVLTALIWGWAEQSQVRTLDKKTIDLEVELAPSTGFAIFQEHGSPPWVQRIRIPIVADFAGQEGAIAQMKHRIETREFPATYSLAADLAADPEARDKKQINLRLIKAFTSDPKLKLRGVDVTGVAPESIAIPIEPLMEFNDLAVEVRFSDGVDRATNAIDAPVKVKLPVALHDRLVRNHKAVLPAEVQESSADASDPTKPLTAVFARQIEGYPISPEPATTLVKLDQSQREYVFDNIPVKAVYSYDFPLADYDLVSDKQYWRKKVVVRGPAGDAIGPDKINLYLKFDLSDKEPAYELSRECEVSLPKGFTLVASKSSDLAVKFKFVKREGRTPP